MRKHLKLWLLLSLTHSLTLSLISDTVCALIDDNRQLSRNPMRGLFPTSEQKGIIYWTLLISVGPCLTLFIFSEMFKSSSQLWDRSSLVYLSHSHKSRALPLDKIIIQTKSNYCFTVARRDKQYQSPLIFQARLLFQDLNSCQAPTGAGGTQI